jgi:glycosyltransferase involved in cell wall biosynthesis
VLTYIPSPYQVELFDALAASGRLRLQVIYRSRHGVGRLWDYPALAHEHVVCEDRAAAAQAREWVGVSDLVIFSWYSDPFARELIRQRAATGLAWCLWGERPSSAWGVLGRLRRRLLLAPVARNRVPIWGIGKWAVDGWRWEFGAVRRYDNVPYFSNLSRFSQTGIRAPKATRTILFSGSLTPRKGVDLLADAFIQVARDHPELRLHLLGTGELELALQKRLGPVHQQVQFIGFRQWGELPDYYRAADVLCAPSRYDGWGLIVPEGLAAGLPVIATDRMGAAIDLVRHGVNGWLMKACSLRDLQDALCQVAEMSNQELDVMSLAATESVASHSLDDGVRRFCDAVDSAFI